MGRYTYICVNTGIQAYILGRWDLSYKYLKKCLELNDDGPNTDLNTHGSNNSGNKLRLYKTFKNCYSTEYYVKCKYISRVERSAFAKFRCGVAPLKIETGRYQSMPLEQRTCFHCSDQIENECHVLLYCPLYTEERSRLLLKAIDIEASFNTMAEVNRLSFLFTNENIVRYTAKACHEMLMQRGNILYHK